MKQKIYIAYTTLNPSVVHLNEAYLQDCLVKCGNWKGEIEYDLQHNFLECNNIVYYIWSKPLSMDELSWLEETTNRFHLLVLDLS